MATETVALATRFCLACSKVTVEERVVTRPVLAPTTPAELALIRIGKGGAVVSDAPLQARPSGPDLRDVPYYGAYLVCESVGGETARRLVGAWNLCAGVPTEELEKRAAQLAALITHAKPCDERDDPVRTCAPWHGCGLEVHRG